MTSLALGNDIAPVNAPRVHTAARPRARVLTSRFAVEEIAEQWLDLESRCDGAVFFQSLAWTRAIYDFEAARHNRGFTPVIATLWLGNSLLAILPLERIKTPTRRVLSPIGQAYAQYADMLLAHGQDPQKALSCLLSAAAGEAPAEGVSFLKVRAGSALERGLPASSVRTGSEMGAPYVTLSGHADFDSYHKTIKSKTRKNMRNARNRLERDGPLEHQVSSGGPSIRGVIERTVSGRAARLRSQGLTSRAFADGSFAKFCDGIVSQPDIELLAGSLRHLGEPIAEQWGFVHNRRYYAFVASRDFAHSEESPGKLHLEEMLRACKARDLVGADLMVPVMPYKLTWATETVPVHDYAVPLNWRGRIAITVWDRALRPWLKSRVLAMPKGLRGILLGSRGAS
ncbi:hypothetical protein GCM10007989_18960 [Devosia pacifica]|uniref:BioF2-like acetyltransferase domain-containing protein n=1 Tax=Devosia pacifica TaxID=1335967 RepID=A0A918VU42_9HYPH|nr:GNAT family N-acetyltransferase [Devosia pacifica]GHA23671.1 hypothetical protein GCM10007989_18960 [Devosia pacifica]